MNSKVSVVVTVYDTEAFLPRCIDSIIGQTYQNLDVILVNDGSPDNSLQILREYEKKDKRIIVIDSLNRGVGEARNLGMNVATGEYIMFIDSDDWIAENAVELMLASLKAHDCQMAVCNLSRVFDERIEPPFFRFMNRKVVEPKAENCKFIKQVFAEQEHIGGSAANKLYKMDLIKDNQIKFLNRSEIFAEDTMFIYQLIGYINRMCFVDVPLYFYYQRKGSDSYTYKKDMVIKWQNLITKTCEHYKMLGYYDHVIDGLKTKCASFMTDILYNEIGANNGYKQFLTVCQNSWLRDFTKDAVISHLSKSKRLVIYLYRKKLFQLLYWVFQLGKNRL